MLPRLVDKFVQTVQKKIPGWNQSLQPYVNELGEAEKEDNLWLRIFDNFISPGFRSAISNTKLDKELERLGDPSIYPSAASKSFTYNKATYNLHADEYTAFATARGTTAGTLMNSLIDSKAYQGLTDLDQVKAQAKAIEYANAIAKAGILNMRGILDSNIDWDALGSWVPKANEYAKLSDSPTALADYIAIKTYTDGMKAEGGVVFGNIADYTYVDSNGENKVDWNEMKNDYLNSLGLSSDEVLYLADAFGIKDGVYQEAQTIIAETPGLTADAYTEALNKFRDLDLERDKAKGEMTDEEFKAWETEHKKAFYDYLNTSKLTGQQKFALLKSIKGAGWDEKAATLADKNIDYDSAWDAIYYHSNLKSTDEASKSKQFYAYLAGKNKLTAEQKFAVISATVGSDYPNKVEELRKQGIGYDAAWNALYTAKTATSTDDAGVLAQVKQNIGKERGLNGKQRFALLGICGGKAVKEKADSFAKQYGMSYDTAWAAMLKYNDKTCHGAEYHSWVDQQSATAKQKFLMLEFTNGQSSWLEKADAFYKEGVKYETTWKIARFAEKQSGRGKKDRIIAYAKSLGLSSKQAEAMYEKFGR
ncbi:MAG: hypothetical protein II410_02595 [Ruminococcus sp.]|nr:hypothetical protein [Ruminococcus sp.]